MSHDQMISLLEAAVILLLMTNAAVAAAATWAIRTMKAVIPGMPEGSNLERKIDSLVRRAG